MLAILLAVLAQRPGSTAVQAERSGQIVLVTTDQNNQRQYINQRSSSQNSQTDPANPPSIEAATAPTIDPPDTTASKSAQQNNLPLPGPTSADNASAAAMAKNNTTSSIHQPHTLSAEDLEFIAAEQKLVQDRKPTGTPTSIQVFGSGKLTGRRFIFLIDQSQSMGDQGLGVLKQASLELSQAINVLQPQHSFQIVVYHNSTSTIGRRRWLPATEQNKQLVPEFLDNLVAYGGTNHEGGLYSALAFNPDVIVMLTDGGTPDLHEGKLDAIKKFAGSTEIHTLRFGLGPNNESSHFLQRLAAKTGGTYRYINIRSWRKNNESN